MSDAALVLAAYRQLGEGAISRLNGDFALALVDADRGQLLLARDVMAARALYYCPLPDAVLFASDIKPILADPRVSAAPDEDALADLLLNNWCDDHRTCFKGIYSVPPGRTVVVARDRIAIREHWAFDPSRQIRYRSFDEYREVFRALFEQSVRRRLRSTDPVAITVSGGLDSSAIFCQAAALAARESLPVRLRGVAMTFPAGSPADEQRFLDEIERIHDVPIDRLPISHLEFLTGADAVVRQLEMPSLVPHSQTEMFGHIRRAGCRVLLHGFFGDQMLSERGYLVDLVRHGQWMRARRELRELAAWSTDEEPRVFEEEFRARLLRSMPPRWLFRFAKRRARRWRARTRYSPVFTKAFRDRAGAREWTRGLPPARFPTEHTEQCYRHATAGHYVRNVRLESGIGSMHGVDVRYPFRDRDLVAFLMAIPGEIVNWQGVPKGLLRHALAGVLPDAIRERRWKADFTELNRRPAGRLPADAFAIRAGFVDGTVLETNDADTSDWERPNPLGLELFLRNFFEDAPASSR